MCSIEIGDVTIYGDELVAFDTLESNIRPASGTAILDFCQDILDMSEDMSVVSKASRRVIHNAIKERLYGMVIALTRKKIDEMRG